MTRGQAIAARIEVAVHIVAAQVPRFRRHFGETFRYKTDGTKVTATDRAISQVIVRVLRRHFPDDPCFSEETADRSPVSVPAGFSWLLDPIDGTNNYATGGLVHCAISLALLEDGRPVYGVIYDFSRGRLIRGGPGYGIWDGLRRVRARRAPASADSLLGFHTPLQAKHAIEDAGLLGRFRIRALGSGTLHLAYVALGFLDATVERANRVWDFAAAYALIQASGAEIHFLDHEPFPLRAFSPQLPLCPYYAGSPAACQVIRRHLLP